MVSKKLKNKIIKRYYTLSYPASFQGVAAFRESLKKNDGINITHSALRRILKSSLPYQVNITKPKRFPKRANYSRGVYQECYCDPVYIPYYPEGKDQDGNEGTKKPKNFLALFAVDTHSRYLYSTKLDSVNEECLKRAFTRLFKNGMPLFSIIRVDRDKSLNLLANNYFAKKGILLLTRRSVHHMAYLEGIIKNCKKRFIKHMRVAKNPNGWTEKRLEKALADVTKSYNLTKNKATGFAPATCNFPEYDPVLRRKLYKEKKIERFEDFYTEKLRLHTRANSPDERDRKPNFDESPDSFVKGDLVYIDFKKPNVGNTAYNVQRGKIYVVSKVNVMSSPYLYKLTSITTNKQEFGWYYGRELASASLSDLAIERIIRRKKSPDKRNLIYVKFKGLDDSYNRWIEQPKE